MGFSFLILMVTISTAVAFPLDFESYLLMPHSLTGSGRCLSWRVAVEANNIRNWTQVPSYCNDYIGHYMRGSQYKQDRDIVCDEALKYAKSLNLTGDGKDVWVFDIDETTLSNLPYFLSEGTWSINSTSFKDWLKQGEAPALKEPLKLYKKLKNLGFKIVFITSMSETYSDVRTKNLKAVGYTEWEKLILKGENDVSSAAVYKSSKRKELEAGGYRIRGNMGDQWSDLLGSHPGDRTFKLPNPIYYIA